MRKWLWTSALLLTATALNVGCPMPNNNGNGNENANDNTSGNVNDNGATDNSNENGDGNGNSNSNGNANENQNGNLNDNSNGNGNDNGNSNSNENGNSNANGNSNDNSNGNGNVNTNDNNSDDDTPPANSQLIGTFSGQATVEKELRSSINDTVDADTATLNINAIFQDGALNQLNIPGFRANSSFLADLAKVGDEDTLIERNAAGQITYRLKAVLTQVAYTDKTARFVAELVITQNSYNSSGTRTSQFKGTGVHVSEFALDGDKLSLKSSTDYDTLLKGDTISLEIQFLESNDIDTILEP